MKKNEEQLSLCERTERYEILSEEIIDGYKIGKLRSYNGTIVNCKIPIHTPEERDELSASICEAMIKFVHPDIDLSNVTYMEVEI